MRYFEAIYAIVRKDIIMEIRSKESVNAMLVFALLMTVVFSFIFEPGSQYKREVVGGIFWMSVVFAGTLGLGKSMVSEVQGGNIDAMMLAPIDRSAIFFGKFISNLLLLLFMEAILTPLFAVFYSINIVTSPKVILIMFLASYGYALLGTLFSVISVRTKAREVMLPLLLLPIMIPIILAAIMATNVFLQGKPAEEASNWITLMAAFDIIFTAVIFAIFGMVIEE